MPMQPIPPPLIEPDEPRCVCISVNESWAVLLLGAVHKMQYPDYWGGSLEENRLARRQAKNLMAIISEAITMGCCCDDRTQIPRRERYTSDGRLEVSYDGGETWENGDNFDPRFNSPLFPPLYTEAGQDVKCIAANNAYTVMKDLVDQLVAEQGLTIDRGVLIVTAFLGALAIIFSGGLAAGIVAWFGGLILGVGQLALQDMFTSTEWDALKCILYCTMGENGSFTPEQWQAAKDQVTQQFEYSPRQILVGIFDLLGPVGLTNAGRKQTASPSVTCEDCNCSEVWCHTIDFTASDGGFSAYSLGASYVPGVGWQTIYSEYALGHVAYIQRNWGSAATIHKATLTFTWNGVPPNPGRTIAYGSVSYGADGPSPLEVEITAEDASGMNLIIGNGGGGSTVSGQITSIRIEGEGPNPFGSSNC